MGIFDFFNKNKKERERQEQLRKQQEAEAKRKAEEQRRRADAQRREEERKRQEQSKKEEEILSNFDFDSNCHQRYEGGNAVMGLQVCPRYLKIRKNTNGCSGYQLKPGDGTNSFWMARNRYVRLWIFYFVKKWKNRKVRIAHV